MTKFNRTEWLLFTAAMVFLASLGLFLLTSVDLGHHLVVGEYTFRNGIPATNIFSPVNESYPLVQHEWAFQVFSYAVTAVAGMNGLAWVRLAIVLAIGVVLHRTLRPGRGFVVAVAFLALGLFVAQRRFIWRPELFSMLFLAMELKLLIDFVEDRSDRLRFIPLIFIVWANVHGYFLVGLIVMGCFAAGEFGDALRHSRDTQRARRLLGIGMLCFAATVLNPYHFEGAIYPFKALINLFTVDSHFNASIGELLPPSGFGHFWSVKAWYPLLLVFVAASAMKGRRVRLSYLLTALAIWLMARSAIRNIGLYGITLGVLAAVQWQTAGDWKSQLRIDRYSRWAAVALSLLLLGMAGFVGTNRLYVFEGGTRMFGAGVDVGLDTPARGFIRDHIPTDLQVFNSFGLGSTYLWWFYPQRRPFLDGNGGAYPPEFFAEYVSISGGKKPFGPFARRHKIDWVYLRPKAPLARILYRNRNGKWHPVFLDGDAIIFVNESPRFDELRERFDLRGALAEGRIPDWVPTPLPTSLRQTFPHREFQLRNFLRRVGEPQAFRTVNRHAGAVLFHSISRGILNEKRSAEQ